MSIIEKIKNFILGRISDEEIASEEWVFCEKCKVNISKKDLISNDYKCPNCNNLIQIIETEENEE